MTAERWTEPGLRIVLAAAMLACLTAPVVMLIDELAPLWPGIYLFLFSFLANLEGILSERLLAHERITGWAYLGSRLAEALTLLLLLKLGSYQALGWEQLWADVQRWWALPESIVTQPDLIAGAVVVAVWLVAIHVSRLLAQLDVMPDPPPPDRGSIEYYLWLTQPAPMTDRQHVLRELGNVFFAGGAVLLLLLTAVRLAFSESRLLLLPILAYFALGVVLLTQGQFSVLQANWHVQRVQVRPGMTRRWLAWATLFMLSISVVALLLPTTYTLLPLQALLGVLTMLMGGLMFVLALILYGLMALLSSIFPGVEAPAQPPLPPLQPPLLSPPPSGEGSQWMQTLLSALFWLLVIGITAWAVMRFARERAGAVRSVAEGEEGWWDRAVAWLRRQWQRWRGWRQEMSTRLAERARQRAGSNTAAPASPGWLALRRLAPRELVRYFYLSTLQRAQRAGLPRAHAQTPYEYRAALERELPEAQRDLSGLTDAFILARYSPQPVAPEDAQAVRPLWQRVREALRRRARRDGDTRTE